MLIVLAIFLAIPISMMVLGECVNRTISIARRGNIFWPVDILTKAYQYLMDFAL